MFNNQLSTIEEFINLSISNNDWDSSPTLSGALNGIIQADPLEYWRNNNIFPKIRILNMMLLSVDISSAVTEGIFSSLKDTIGSRRHRLNYDLTSKVVMLPYMINQKSCDPNENWFKDKNIEMEEENDE